MIKAISYHQPYAWMLANGHLDIDDRTWGTSHRGPLAIHASKAFSKHYYDYVKHVIGIDIPAVDQLEFGGFVAVVNLKDCLKPGDPTDVPHDRRAHGGPHCYGWVIDQVEKIDFIPWRGQQGLFDIDIHEARMAVAADTSPKQNSLF